MWRKREEEGEEGEEEDEGERMMMQEQERMVGSNLNMGGTRSHMPQVSPPPGFCPDGHFLAKSSSTDLFLYILNQIK